MLDFNSSELILIFNQLFFLVARILSIISIVPIFGEVVVNKKIKIILSVLISILVIPMISLTHISLLSTNGVLILFEQVIIGIMIGFFIRLMFFFINVTGEILGLQMGLSFSTVFDPFLKINISVISRFLNLFLLLLFLSLNGHLWIIWIIVKSFDSFPIESIKFNNDLFYFFINYVNKIYTDGIILSLPIIFFLIGTNIIIGFLNRLSPQISFFSIGFPIILLFSILFLFFSTHIIFFFLISTLKDLSKLLSVFLNVQLNLNIFFK